jgi:hypothetical protein
MASELAIAAKQIDSGCIMRPREFQNRTLPEMDR